MAKFWNSLSGYKTYITAAAGVLLVIAQHNGVNIPGIHVDDNVVWQAVIASCLRAGIANSPGNQPGGAIGS